MSPARRQEGPAPISLVEEAVHLLRQLPISAWGPYLLGVVPWTIGVVMAWSRVTWFVPHGEILLGYAALGAVLYLGLKRGQRRFGQQLLALRRGVAPERVVPRGRWQAGLRLLRAHGVSPVVHLVCAPLILPFTTVFAYFQNITVLLPTDGDEKVEDAWRLARQWPFQLNMVLFLVVLCGVGILINFVSLFYALPWLANRLLGLDNFLGINGFAGLNSTFWMLNLMLTWLTLDPLLKAIFVLRIFYGRARHSGEDLLEALPRRAPRGASVLLFALILWGGSAGFEMHAAEDPGLAAPAQREGGHPVGAISPTQLDSAMTEALQQRDFVWSLRPLPDAGAQELGPVGRFFKSSREHLKVIARRISDAWDRLVKWVDDLFPDRPREATPMGEMGGLKAFTKPVLWGLIGLLSLIVGWMLWTVWKTGRTQIPRGTLRVSRPATPDLRDENVHAGQLPFGGWLDLARQQIAAGEWRLALRALYLARLAWLAHEGWVALRRSKTNADYERELRHKAFGRPELCGEFQQRRLGFEVVWYGRGEADPADVQAQLASFPGGEV